MKANQRKQERGYTLLEYCAGAAIIVTVLYTALNGLGDQLSQFLGNIGTWAVSHAPENKIN
jgi:Flp pilus assembly pilin Flp